MVDIGAKEIAMLTGDLDETSRIVFHTQFSSAQKDRGIATILAILGFDRFYLGQIGLGIAKYLSCFFLVGFLWVFIDIFTAAGRADDFNRSKAWEIVNALKTRRSTPSGEEIAP
jgi:TM2 domain-containing membrane protein YozV